MRPAQGEFPEHRKGDLWASQQLGEDDEPMVAVEYGSNSLTMKVEDLLPLRNAIDGLLEVFSFEVMA